MSDQPHVRALDELRSEFTRAASEHPELARRWPSHPAGDIRPPGLRSARRRVRVSLSNVVAVVMVIVVVAIGGVFVLSLTASAPQSSAPVTAAPGAKLPLAQLVAIAEGMRQGLGDPQVSTAEVVQTGKNAAENWLEAGAASRDPTDPRAYVIVLLGTFVCDDCSSPPGVKAPHGHSAQTVWVPGVGVDDGGLSPHTPPGLGRLGKVVTIRLTPPKVPASQQALRTSFGIGPASLGQTLSALNQQLGPAISPGDFAVGSIQITAGTDGSGRIDALGTDSPQATLDGHLLAEGYTALHRALPGWQVLHCTGSGDVTELSHEHGRGISTRIQFRNGIFDRAYIGHVRPSDCEPPDPS